LITLQTDRPQYIAPEAEHYEGCKRWLIITEQVEQVEHRIQSNHSCIHLPSNMLQPQHKATQSDMPAPTHEVINNPNNVMPGHLTFYCLSYLKEWNDY
jgi:hypothetical protein